MVNFSSRKCLACQWLEALRRELDALSGGKPRFPYKAPANRKPRSYNRVNHQVVSILSYQMVMGLWELNVILFYESYYIFVIESAQNLQFKSQNIFTRILRILQQQFAPIVRYAA